MRVHVSGTLALAVAAVVGAACAPSLIPGTEIQDTKVNRSLLGEIELYRQAVERRDATAILALVSPSYYDERGHPDDPSYHWDYARLAKELPQKLSKVKDVRLEINVRHINVKDGKAKAAYFYTENYIATLPSGELPEHEADIDRMEFQRQGDRWLITKGL
ncbi:MAG TPA: hypothetical protein VMB50_15085 [Myxococcales bacterium]|nr:hypothetical protein [Myxococcales bacterium]